MFILNFFYIREFSTPNYLDAQYIDNKDRQRAIVPDRIFESNLPPINSTDRIGRLMPPLSTDLLEPKHLKWLNRFDKDNHDKRQRNTISRFLDVPRYPHENEFRGTMHPFFNGFSRGVFVAEVRDRAFDAYLLDRRPKKKISTIQHSKPWLTQKYHGSNIPRPLLKDEMVAETSRQSWLMQQEIDMQRMQEDTQIRQWQIPGGGNPSRSS